MTDQPSVADEPSALADALERDVRELIRALADARFQLTERSRETAAAECQWLLDVAEVADAFNRVLRNMDARPEHMTGQVRVWVGNLKAVRRLLERQLTHRGASRMADTPTFDPARHTIVETIEDAARAEGDIADTVRPGYERAGRILRKAEVKVVRNGDG